MAPSLPSASAADVLRPQSGVVASWKEYLAFPHQASPPVISSTPLSIRERSDSFDIWKSVGPLFPAAAAAWLSYVSLAVLFYSPAIRVYEAGALHDVLPFRTAAFALAPNALLSGRPESGATLVAMVVYLAIAAIAFGSWCWSMRIARTVELRSSLLLIGLTAAIALPLLVAPGLLSDDLYLYNLYGRTIGVYGANPVIAPPSTFGADPHLPWVHWRDLPSAYGPIWLMLSAALSGAAGESVTAAVLWYRVAGLSMHLAVAGMLWTLLRKRRSTAALRATLFYAWNPLVLLEVVANAHNDVLVALFAVLLIGAAAQHRWLSAAFFGACAVMVKPFAIVLLPAVARHLLRSAHGRSGLKRFAAAAGVGAFTATAVSLPLWAGVALAKNAMGNPAAHMYTNTLWELISDAGPAWFGVMTVAIQHPYLDILRGLGFLAGFAWVLTRPAARHDLPQVAIRLWLVFCLTACWVWPWYFVPALALAPLAGAAHLPMATALTVGGLLFWTGWPERNVWPLESVYGWRSVLLFGPVLVIWAWAPARTLVFQALGFRRRHEIGDDGAVDGRLQTAAG